ncbi:MAG: PAS domain-containing protein [Deltaproteobacteria bacterium]|nr:PAS domain-containing protein [Deltaproteobacteria bacterium]
MKIRLSYKFMILFCAIGIAAVAILGLRIQGELREELMHRVEEEMSAEARIIALMPTGEITRQTPELASRARARLTLIDAAGRVLADSEPGVAVEDDHLNRSELQEARLRGKGAASRYSRTLKKEALYVAILVKDGERIVGYVRLSRTLPEITPDAEKAGAAVFRILFWTIVPLLLIALWASFRMVSPIGRVAAFTKRIRLGSFPGILRIRSRDEIGELAENLNDMVAVLKEEIRLAGEEKQQLEAIFSGMSEGVMLLDAEDRIALVNRGMEEMIGLTAGEMAGRTVLETVRNVELHDALARFRASREPLFAEIALEGDPPAVMDVRISAVRGESGDDGKTMLVFHDVTRLKRLERVRTDFVANVTHEIRTPLTAIIGFVETMEQGAVDDREKALEFLKTIRENAERLNRLVDDLLTLSAIELGEMKLRVESVDPGKALEQTLALIAAKAAGKGVKIADEISGPLPAIRADRDRLMQILLNTLDNAVKFTPPGGSVSVTAAPVEEKFLAVRIADTGIGIPKGEISRLGERFYRTERARSREMGGTGLGLSIVKHLMMAMQGRIGIESTVGRGTTVSLYFPLYREA